MGIAVGESAVKASGGRGRFDVLDKDALAAAQPLILLSDVVVVDGLARFTIRLDHAATGTVRVDVGSARGNAIPGADYTQPQPQTLVFAPGEVLKTVLVDVRDYISSSSKWFDLVLSSPQGAKVLRLDLSSPQGLRLGDGPGDVLGVIRDNDRPTGRPVIRVDDGVADGWEPFARFNVWLDRPSDSLVTVRYATGDGSAQAQSDCAGKGVQTLVFAPGEVDKTVLVPLVNQAVVSEVFSGPPEGMEFFDLLLSGTTNAELADPIGHMVLSPQSQYGRSPPPVRAVAAATLESGTTLDAMVMLANPSYGGHTLRYTLSGQSAQAGADFVAQSGQLEFAPGQTLQQLRIPLLDDVRAEGTETFLVRFYSGAGTEPVATLQARILDDETPSAVPQTLVGGDGVANLLVGQPGTSLVVGGARDDLLDGVGAVTLRGLGGNDGHIVDGDDVLESDTGDDTLDGGAGDDRLSDRVGTNLLSGGAGADTLEGGERNTLLGGTGPDSFEFGFNSFFNGGNPVDSVADWSSVDDRFVFTRVNGYFSGQGQGLGLGNGDDRVEGALLRDGPGGFSTSAELVVFTRDIDGAISSASAAFDKLQAHVYVVDNGTTAACFSSRTGIATRWLTLSSWRRWRCSTASRRWATTSSRIEGHDPWPS